MWNRPISTILADWFFVPKWRFPAKQDLRRPPREKGKEKSAGAEEKERPPERATLLNRIFEKPSHRGEEDTEQENKTSKNFRQGRP